MDFATVPFQVDRVAGQAAALRTPHSRSVGASLYELWSDLERVALW